MNRCGPRHHAKARDTLDRARRDEEVPVIRDAVLLVEFDHPVQRRERVDVPDHEIVVVGVLVDHEVLAPAPEQQRERVPKSGHNSADDEPTPMSMAPTVHVTHGG